MQYNEQELYDLGLYYRGTKKKYRGKVNCEEFFKIPHLAINTFGYYENSDKKWIVFVTDDERGVEAIRRRLSSEEEALNELSDLTENYNFIHLCNTVLEKFSEKEPLIKAYLSENYGYTDAKADNAIKYLMKAKYIAFEFVYYIENGDFVPDKFANNYSGYTAKRLKEETSLTVLGAFNYMVYLKDKPDEALLNLKKGLPRRKILS